MTVGIVAVILLALFGCADQRDRVRQAPPPVVDARQPGLLVEPIPPAPATGNRPPGPSY